MIKKISAEKRFFQDLGFLKTFWLFSFSNYHDPENMNFGSLRVFNDDIVMPGSGFPDHPHDTMEIVTLVHSGTLTHTDSMGNNETIEAGEIQQMSAGEGIVHSEFNNHVDPVHLYQLWFYPNQKTTTGYQQRKIESKPNSLTLLASREDHTEGLLLKADAKIFQLDMLAENEISYNLHKGTGLFIYVMSGSFSINDQVFKEGDQTRVSDEEKIIFKTNEYSRALVVEVLL